MNSRRNGSASRPPPIPLPASSAVSPQTASPISFRARPSRWVEALLRSIRSIKSIRCQLLFAQPLLGLIPVPQAHGISLCNGSLPGMKLPSPQIFSCCCDTHSSDCGSCRDGNSCSKTERVSVYSGRDRLLWHGLRRWVPPSVPSFIPLFTFCDGWTEFEGRGTCSRPGSEGSGEMAEPALVGAES